MSWTALTISNPNQINHTFVSSDAAYMYAVSTDGNIIRYTPSTTSGEIVSITPVSITRPHSIYTIPESGATFVNPVSNDSGGSLVLPSGDSQTKRKDIFAGTVVDPLDQMFMTSSYGIQIDFGTEVYFNNIAGNGNFMPGGHNYLPLNTYSATLGTQIPIYYWNGSSWTKFHTTDSVSGDTGSLQTGAWSILNTFSARYIVFGRGPSTYCLMHNAFLPNKVQPLNSTFNVYTKGSNSGQYVFVLYSDPSGGPSGTTGTSIYRSADFGQTFANISIGSGKIGCIDCSASGQYVYILSYYDANMYGNGKLFISSDYGATFTTYNYSQINASYADDADASTYHIRCSDSGQYVMVSLYVSDSFPTIYVSSDYGNNFVGLTGLVNSNYRSVAISGDGTLGYAFPYNPGTGTSFTAYYTTYSGSYANLLSRTISKVSTSGDGLRSINYGGGRMWASFLNGSSSSSNKSVQISTNPTSSTPSFDGTLSPSLNQDSFSTSTSSSFSRDGSGAMVQYNGGISYSTNVSCIFEGSFIRIIENDHIVEKKIEDLKAGDILVTTKGTTQLKNIFKSPIIDVKDSPYKIPKDYIEKGKPYEDAYVSEWHFIFTDAEKLEGFHPLHRKDLKKSELRGNYYHLLTNDYSNDVIYVNGLNTETYGVEYRGKVKCVCDEKCRLEFI